jgi:hypothetical protein
VGRVYKTTGPIGIQKPIKIGEILRERTASLPVKLVGLLVSIHQNFVI